VNARVQIDKEKEEIRREYEKKKAQFLRLRQELMTLPTIPEEILSRAKRDFNFFCSAFLWTYNPRGEEKEIPFILYPFQEWAALEIIEHIVKKKDLLIEKSRDMGATWLILAIFLWGFLFHGWHLKVGSRKDEAVDRYGDMDTLFERLRFMIRTSHLQIRDMFKEKEHFKEKLIKHPQGVNAIVGEATTSTFSRSGRYNSILLDEFSFVPPQDSDMIWQACGDSTPCRIALSTPPVHMRGKFVDLRMGGYIDVLTLHWRLHPYKTEEWYEEEKKRRSKREIAIELDIDYTASSDDRLATMSEVREGMARVVDTEIASRRVISVDLARFGEDETVIKVGWLNSKGQGYCAQTYTLKHRKATQVLGFLSTIRRRGDLIIIDAVGMGESFMDFVESSLGEVIPFIGSNKSHNPTILNLRAEAYFYLADLIKKGKFRDDDEKARQQLVMLWYDYSAAGKKMVVSKEKLRQQGIKSPDHADAMMMLAWGLRFVDVVVEDKTNKLWKQIQEEVRMFAGGTKWEELKEDVFEEVF